MNFLRFKLTLEKAEEPEVKVPPDHRESRRVQEGIYLCFTDHAKAFDCVDHSKLWKVLKEMGIPDHLTCLLRNPYAGK